jgi:inorganic pyrophosphatase
MNRKDIPIGETAPEIIRAVIEIPEGSRNKYVFDVEYNVFRLDRVLYSPVHYPMAYGFIPQTIGDDENPINILVKTIEPIPVGIVLKVKPIGILLMEDEKGSDNKILSVPFNDPNFIGVQDLLDLPGHLLIETEYFFKTYKLLEGKEVKSFGWENAEIARQKILKGMKLYQESLKNQ